MSVISMCVGATTPDGATFVAKVTTGPVRVAVADNEAMTGPVFTSSQAVDAQGVAKVSINGLAADTEFWWQTEDNSVLDTSITGRFHTHPALGSRASFTLAVSGDAGAGSSGYVTADRVSNHPVFDTIRGHDPLLFLHLGDFHYRDIGSGVYSSSPYDETDYRDSYDLVLAQPRQHQLYREVPLVYTWDNHDFGFLTGSSIDSDGDLPHKAAARAVYRERVPHYPLPEAGAIYHSFQIGRVLFIILDCRSERSPNSDPDTSSKTLLGTAQKAWLDNLLANTSASALCVISSGQWITQPTEDDTWAAYETERAEVVGMFAEHGWLDRMFMLTASMHALGLDTGSGNVNGGFPVGLFAALDATPAGEAVNLYDLGPTQPGVGQYGTVQVTDLGSTIAVKLTGWQSGSVWKSYTFGIAAQAPTVSADAFLRAVSGSHRATFEARVLTSFQTGDNPTGTIIPILSGDVVIDGGADIRGTLEMETDGLWPRGKDRLLAPFGNEVFVRRGVDLGPEIQWVPLGYFRIDTPEQDDAPDGVIRLSCKDRMSSIIDGRLLEPRQFDPGRTVGSVITELVTEIYPGAVIVWDDDSDQAQLGRVYVVEGNVEDASRYNAVLDLVLATGKIMYWDGDGVLRIETAPELTDIAWEVREGPGGVLVRAGRRLTREGVYNCVVAYGEGTDDKAAARAVAVDNGPNSATRFGGPFGKVPRFYSSPVIKTAAQARSAAVAILRRAIGIPYSVDLTAVPNPTLKPFDVIRVVTDDGRETHVVDRVTIPLTHAAAMSIGTREQSLILIGVS